MPRQRKQHKRAEKSKAVENVKSSPMTSSSDKGEGSMIPLAVSCGIISICLYANTLFHEFTLDDHSAIEKNWVLRGSSPWSAVITTDIWGGDLTSLSSHYSWRPLMVLTLRLNYALSGLNPLPYHLFNIVFNAVTCIMLVIWFLPTLPAKAVPFPYPWILSPYNIFSIAVALIFTCHPIHTESIANSQNRAEPLCAFFSFWAFNMHYTFMKKSNVDYAKLGKLILLIWCAALCKELGITLTVICAIHDISYNILPVWFGNKKVDKRTEKSKNACFIRVFWLAICSFMYLGLRKIWFYQNSPNPSFEDNPLIFSDQTTRFRTALYLQWRYIGLLLFPTHLSSDYSYNAIPLVESWTDLRLLFVLGLIIVLMVIVYQAWIDAVFNDDRRLVVGLAWLYMPLLPASHIVVVGTVIAERLLFTPSLGYAIIFSYFLEKLLAIKEIKITGPKLKKPGEKSAKIIQRTLRERSNFLTNLVRICLYLMLILYSAGTLTNNMAWYDSDSLARRLYANYPTSVKAVDGMSSLHHRHNEWDLVLKYSEEALLIKNDMPSAYTALTKLYRFSEEHRNLTKALENADKCIKFSRNRKGTAACHYQKGGIYNELEKIEMSIKELDQSLAYQMANPSAFCFHGDIFGKAGRFKEAEKKYEVCIKRNEGSVGLVHWLNYAQSMLQLGKEKEAEPILRRILPQAQKENPSMAGHVTSILEQMRKVKNNKKRRQKKKKHA